jgi:dynein light chain roadblock-type
MELANVEEMLNRLSSQKGVVGVLVADMAGVPVRSTMDPENSTLYAAMASELARKAREFLRCVAPDDDLNFLRLRSTRKEIIVAHSFDHDQGLSLVVVQEPGVVP